MKKETPKPLHDEQLEQVTGGKNQTGGKDQTGGEVPADGDYHQITFSVATEEAK